MNDTIIPSKIKPDCAWINEVDQHLNDLNAVLMNVKLKITRGEQITIDDLNF